jgi:hypothetical protein
MPPFDWTYFEFVVAATNSASVLQFVGQGVFIDLKVVAGPVVDDVNLIPVTPPRLQSPVLTPGHVQFGWDALPGVRYQLQSTTNLALPAWQNLDSPITTTNPIALATNAIGPDPRRFYRVKIVP